jgi:hypothetical protein
LRRDSVGCIRKGIEEQRDHLDKQRHPGCVITVGVTTDTDIEADISNAAHHIIIHPVFV